MKLTTKSEYSILAMIYLARHTGDYVKIDKICANYGIPKKYLEFLFTILKQHRYLKTRRGAGGGYTLTKQPSEISIADIIRLMDGALAPTESVSEYFFSHTPVEKEPDLINVFREIRNFIAQKMENLTLADLA